MSKLIKGTDPQPSDNGFIGVDPIYQNFANETERPYLAEKGADKKVESQYVTKDVDTSQGATPEGDVEEEEVKEEESSTKSTPSTPTPPATPPAS